MVCDAEVFGCVPSLLWLGQVVFSFVVFVLLPNIRWTTERQSRKIKGYHGNVSGVFNVYRAAFDHWKSSPIGKGWVANAVGKTNSWVSSLTFVQLE